MYSQSGNWTALVVAAAVMVLASPASAQDPSACAKGDSSGRTWSVNVAATTFPNNSSYPPAGAPFVLLEPDGKGCWHVARASPNRMPRQSEEQELLILDLDQRVAVVAYEFSGRSAWCWDDKAKNRVGYGPCRSSLVEPSMGARWVGDLLRGSRNPPPADRPDRMFAVSADRVVALLNTVTDIDKAVSEGLRADEVRRAAQAEMQKQRRAEAERISAETVRQHAEAERQRRELAAMAERARIEESNRAARQQELQRWTDLERRAVSWRKLIKEGTETHCGMVIEKKPTIIKVQTMIGEYWMRLEQLYPPSTVSCRFINREYIEPTRP